MGFYIKRRWVPNYFISKDNIYYLIAEKYGRAVFINPTNKWYIDKFGFYLVFRKLKTKEYYLYINDIAKIKENVDLFDNDGDLFYNYFYGSHYVILPKFLTKLFNEIFNVI
jgi:hypothetical protein